MASKRHKPEEIVSKLRQVDVLRGQGLTIADVIRQIGVTQLTYYRWRKTYGGMGIVHTGCCQGQLQRVGEGISFLRRAQFPSHDVL